MKPLAKRSLKTLTTRTSRARHGGAAGNRKCSDMNSEYNGILQISILNHEQWSFVLALHQNPGLAPLHLSVCFKIRLKNTPLLPCQTHPVPPPLLLRPSCTPPHLASEVGGYIGTEDSVTPPYNFLITLTEMIIRS